MNIFIACSDSLLELSVGLMFTSGSSTKHMSGYTGIGGCETVTTPVEKVNGRKNARFKQK
jgi:hypothetical protein